MDLTSLSTLAFLQAFSVPMPPWSYLRLSQVLYPDTREGQCLLQPGIKFTADASAVILRVSRGYSI